MSKRKKTRLANTPSYKLGSVWVKTQYNKKGERIFYIYQQMFRKEGIRWIESNRIVYHGSRTLSLAFAKIRHYIKYQCNGIGTIGISKIPINIL